MREFTKLPKKSSIDFGSERIEFEIATSTRSTLAISVHPDQRISVVAPKDSSLDKISEKVKKRAPWIIKKRIYFSQFLPSVSDKKYVSGESFYFLGRQYRLRITTGIPATIKLSPGTMTLSTAVPSDKESVRHVLWDWYRLKAKTYFHQRLSACFEKFQKCGIEEPRLVVRKMQFRWGSCTKSGLIIINQDLIQAPSHCIDYVICHELTHLKVRNHTPEFFKILSRVMPDWEARRRRLEKFVL